MCIRDRLIAVSSYLVYKVPEKGSGRWIRCGMQEDAAGAGGGIPFSDSGHGGYAGSHSFAGEL